MTPPPATISGRCAPRITADSAGQRRVGDRLPAMCQTRLANSSSGQSYASAWTSCGSASVTAPVSAGSVSTRIAASSADGSCSGRLTRSQYRETGLKASLTLTSQARRVLELLEDRVGDAGREHVARQQQHGDAVDRGERGAGDHVGRARADRRRDGERRQPVAVPRVADGRVHHRLLVAALEVAAAPLTGALPCSPLEQRLADAGDVAVAEDAPAAGEEGVLDAVALDVLLLEEARRAPAPRSAGRCSSAASVADSPNGQPRVDRPGRPRCRGPRRAPGRRRSARRARSPGRPSRSGSTGRSRAPPSTGRASRAG